MTKTIDTLTFKLLMQYNVFNGTLDYVFNNECGGNFASIHSEYVVKSRDK